MKLIGITGGIGAGKSQVTGIFARLGATIVDADAISRQVMQKDGAAYTKVVSAFGIGILNPDGEIDRKRLAALVFSDATQRERLNRITHAVIFEEMQRQIDQAKTKLVCLDVPLLFDSAFPFLCEKTIAVLAPKEVRIARVMERDGIAKEQIEARMAAQLTDEELRQKADFMIENIGSIKELEQKVIAIYQNIME